MNKKKLFLHIGCGKTGSSALQVWLHNNARSLNDQGLHYPVAGKGKLEDYAITSGNGVLLIDMLRKGVVDKFLYEVSGCDASGILFSSEGFQALSSEELRLLKNSAEKFNLDIQIIVYVRDVYDVVYSLYQQWVKRHLGHKVFRDFVFGLKGVQQFDVLRKYARSFEQMTVFHYDSEKKLGLERSLCFALGIDVDVIPSMSVAKVNRSLTIFETEVLRVANKEYVEHFKGRDNGFSKRISDALIQSSPEESTEILLDLPALDYLERLCSGDVDEVNRNYLSIGRLQIFNDADKVVVNTIPPMPSVFVTVIASVMRYFSVSGVAGVVLESNSSAVGKNAEGGLVSGSGCDLPFRASSPKVVDAIRDEAVRLEGDDLAKSYALMAAAAVLRPNGQYIQKKLEQYKKKMTKI